MKRYTFFLSLVFLNFLVCLSQAQPTGLAVSGKIKEGITGKPLEYVSVGLYLLPDSSLVSGTITDNSGNYILLAKKPGKHYVSTDFMGYERFRSESFVLNAQNNHVNLNTIALNISKYGIDEVEVVASEPLVSYKLDRKVVNVSRNLMAEGGTAVDALEHVPSVQTDMEGNVTLRGSSSFTVLIDGRRTPLDGSDALNQIPASTIDKIEIITNPSAKYDPEGTAGIINIITKKGIGQGSSAVINASAGTGPLYSADGIYTMRRDKFTLTTGLNYRYNNTESTSKSFTEYTYPEEQEGIQTINNKTIGNRYGGSLGANADLAYKISKNNTASVGIKYSEFSRGYSSSSYNLVTDTLGMDTYFLTDNIDDMKRPYLQVQIGDRFDFIGEEHYLKADFYYQKNRNNADEIMSQYISDAEWNRIEFKDTDNKLLSRDQGQNIRLEMDYSKPITEKLKLEAGYALRDEFTSMNYDVYERDTKDADWSYNPDYSNSYDFTQNIQSIYSLIAGEKWGLQYSAGLRGEYTNRQLIATQGDDNYVYRQFDLYPSAALTHKFKGGNTLQTSYSKRINRPHGHYLYPYPLYSDGFSTFRGNPDLNPENVHSFELNHQKAFGESFFSTELFFSQTTDPMQRVTFLDSASYVKVMTMQNLDKEIRTGAEIMANLILFKWWMLDPSVSVYYYELQGFYDGKNKNTTSINSRAMLNNTFTLPTKTKLQLTANYNSPSATIEGSTEAVFYMNFAARQDLFKRKLSLTFKIDDILNSRKRESTSDTDQYYSTGSMKRSGTVVSLSLSYKINNQRDNKGMNGEKKGERVIDTGRDDMEF